MGIFRILLMVFGYVEANKELLKSMGIQLP